MVCSTSLRRAGAPAAFGSYCTLYPEINLSLAPPAQLAVAASAIFVTFCHVGPQDAPENIVLYEYKLADRY